MIILAAADYERLAQAVEDAADVAAYDLVKRKLANGEDEMLPAMVNRILDGENPLRVWREHRGLSARALADRTGIAQACSSQIETGKRDGTIETIKKIAATLEFAVDDLI